MTYKRNEHKSIVKGYKTTTSMFYWICLRTTDSLICYQTFITTSRCNVIPISGYLNITNHAIESEYLIKRDPYVSSVFSICLYIIRCLKMY